MLHMQLPPCSWSGWLHAAGVLLAVWLAVYVNGCIQVAQEEALNRIFCLCLARQFSTVVHCGSFEHKCASRR